VVVEEEVGWTKKPPAVSVPALALKVERVAVS
jgi:hypothetical protein